jgi:hypothetical protein
MKTKLLLCFTCLTLSMISQKFDTSYIKRHPESTLEALKAYVYLAQRAQMYGTGLMDYRYTDQCDYDVKWGLCEGWKGNFFVQKKNETTGEVSTEYLKIEQIHHAQIKYQCGTKYIKIYPSPGYHFERRLWRKGETNYYKTEELYWIMLYIDWSQEDDLAGKFLSAFNIWGKLNNKEFDDTEKFE